MIRDDSSAGEVRKLCPDTVHRRSIEISAIFGRTLRCIAASIPKRHCDQDALHIRSHSAEAPSARLQPKHSMTVAATSFGARGGDTRSRPCITP